VTGVQRFALALYLGGVRGVQMHPPLAASNVFLYKTARVH